MKEKLWTILIGIIAIAIGYSILGFIDKILNKNKVNDVQQIAQDVKIIKENLSPYEYKNTLEKIEIINGNGFNNSSIKNKPTNIFEKQIQINGQFLNGYLYAKVSADKQPLTKWSDLYIKISRSINNNVEEYGGHLITSKGLETPRNENYTEILFNLSDIKYKESYKDTDINSISSDWLKLLNTNEGESKIISFMSTTGEGEILELSIYYECATDSVCSINLK